MSDTPALFSSAMDHLWHQPSAHTKLGVAVSGGSDSLALLYLAAEWANAHSKTLAAITVDHGLRPEARDEARLVQHHCHRLGIAHKTLEWSPDISAPMQADTRHARHKLLAEWTDCEDISHLLLGHTLGDDLETALMRCRAGSGWFGMAGLAWSSPSPVWPQGKHLTLLRPLLKHSRQQLKDWLRQKDIDWVSDPSNKDRRYERVRTRTALAQLPDEKRERFALTIERLKHLRHAQMTALEQFSSEYMEWREDGSAHINASAFWKSGRNLACRCLEYTVMSVSGAPTPPRLSDVEKLYERLKSGTHLNATLGDGWIVRDEHLISIYRRPEIRHHCARLETQRFSATHTKNIWDNRFEITAASPLPPGEIISRDVVAAHGRPAVRIEGFADRYSIRTQPYFLPQDATGQLPAEPVANMACFQVSSLSIPRWSRLIATKHTLGIV